MLTVISPAKTLDYESPIKTKNFSQPDFLEDSQQLIGELRELAPHDISELMHVSPAIGELNYSRFLNWHRPFSPDNARQAIFAFKGDVYTGIDIQTYKAADLKFAQQHLRILSGLYGLLRPLDLMQPYRLEMSTRLQNRRGKNLYEFWDGKVTEAVNQALSEQGDEVLVNLASNEYYKVLKPKQLRARVITPVFKDYKNGQYKVISFHAKKARGLMTSHILKHRLKTPTELESFAEAGYRFNPELSKPDAPVFTRREAR